MMQKLALIIGGMIVTGATAVGQLVVDHMPGIVLRADFNQDQYEDILVLDGDTAHSYLGTPQMPFLKAGASTSTPNMRRSSLPLIVGRHLYVPSLGAWHFTSIPQAWVDVYRLMPDGSLGERVSRRLDALNLGAGVTTMRLADLGFDHDGDGYNDVLVLWGELPEPTQRAFSAAYLSPRTMGPRVLLPFAPQQRERSWIAGLHLARSVAQPADDHLVVVSGPTNDPAGGFGFTTLNRGQDGPVVGGTRWIASVPSLAHDGYLSHASPATYGKFQPTPAFSVPLVKLYGGRSILFHPEFYTPFVSWLGSPLSTTARGFFIDGATADYDGDGADEVVFVEPGPQCIGDLLVIADPGEGRAYIQAFLYGSPGRCGGWVEPEPFHAAPADLNGDGALDLVVLRGRWPEIGSSFSVLVGDPQAAPGQPPLRRAY